MTEDIIWDAMMKLQGAVTIVYPMNLPPHDPIRLEFEGTEDLSGTQVIFAVITSVPRLWTVQFYVYREIPIQTTRLNWSLVNLPVQLTRLPN